MAIVKLLKHQREALTAKEDEVLLLGGIATGKTLCGAMWVVDKISQFPDCELLIVANTYSQLMTATVKTLIQYLEDLEIPHHAVLSGSRKRIEIGASTIYLYSLEKPDSIRGIEVEFIWGDEIAFSSLQALNVIRGRLRGRKATYRQMLMTTSGNGFNFLYDLFGDLQPEQKGKLRLISAKTEDNTFLPEDTYPRLLEQYGGLDSDLAKQELLGQFVNLQEGAIYNMFDRKINLKECQLDLNYPVLVGCDFNIDTMSAVYVQQIKGVIYVCGEVQLTHRDANTYDLSARIIKDLKGFTYSIYADSTGSARKSSTPHGLSDHQIMRDTGLHLVYTNNPKKRDRQNSVNLLFRKEGIYINPKCKKLIKDIETLSARHHEGKHSHLGPSLGYVVFHIKPIKRPQQKSRQIRF